MNQWTTQTTTWKTEQRTLDGNLFQAELAPEGDLWLTNETNKEEVKLSWRATYELMVFLQERAVQLYEATHRPRQVCASGDLLAGYRIVTPTVDEGEHATPPAMILYADPDDPLLGFVYAVAQEWAQEAYEGAARITRIISAPSSEDTPERIPAFLEGHTLWTHFTGEADQSWKVTIWPLAGWQRGLVDHLYLHKIGDELVTGNASSGYANARPHHLFLPLNEEEEGWQETSEEHVQP